MTEKLCRSSQRFAAAMLARDSRVNTALALTPEVIQYHQDLFISIYPEHC